MLDLSTLSNVPSCDREPIHAPGSIQPHGMMLIADDPGLIVRHVAGDIEERLGVADWRGRPLAGLIGDVLTLEAERLVVSERPGGFVGQLKATTGEILDVSVQHSGPFVIVELETASTEASSVSRAIDSLAAAAAGFERTSSLNVLCQSAATEFQHLTRFDRVSVYRFLDDDAGKVIAEDRRGDLKSFLNHHFPASDIPRQARALYLRNLVRVIPDVAYVPVALRPDWAGTVPLDMSDCNLRSISPVHLLYLANMGVKASASFSIVEGGRLWGLITCHNEQPRRLTHDVRAACRFLVGSLAQQIKAKGEAEELRQRIRLRSFEDSLVTILSRNGSLDETLSDHLDEIGRMMDCDGVAVLRGRELVTGGICPRPNDIHDLAAWLPKRDRVIFSTDHLQGEYAPGKAFERLGSGLLAMALSGEAPMVVLWFRREQVEVVNWAGNPHKGVEPDPMRSPTPRASFEAWSETVRGRARAWTVSEVGAATRLRAALLDARQNQRVLDLNRQLTVMLDDKDLLLQQKEFLAGEVNRRVWDSLDLVSGFLESQALASDDPGLRVAIGEARRRVAAVALVHRRLYRGDPVEVVDAARYIEELCKDTFSFMGPEWSKHLTFALSPVQVSTDQAVSLGLVLTELLIDVNKNAYGGAAGPIEIEIIQYGNRFQLVVSDKGSGKAATRKGLGSRMMDGLLKQLDGKLTHGYNGPGLRVTVTVPSPSPKRPS